MAEQVYETAWKSSTPAETRTPYARGPRAGGISRQPPGHVPGPGPRDKAEPGTRMAGPAADAFANHWKDLKAGMDKTLPQVPQVAKSLDEAADAIEEINHEIHQIYLEIGTSIGISVGLSFLTMGFSAAAGAARAAQLAARAAKSPRRSAPSSRRPARRSKPSPRREAPLLEERPGQLGQQHRRRRHHQHADRAGHQPVRRDLAGRPLRGRRHRTRARCLPRAGQTEPAADR